MVAPFSTSLDLPHILPDLKKNPITSIAILPNIALRIFVLLYPREVHRHFAI